MKSKISLFLLLTWILVTGSVSATPKVRDYWTDLSMLSSLDFRDVIVGESASRWFQIVSTGTGSVRFDYIQIYDEKNMTSDSPFKIDWVNPVSFPFIMDPGDTEIFSIIFEPLVAKQFSSFYLVIESNDDDDPIYDVRLTGTGLPAQVSSVPEPGTFLLLCSGLLAMAGVGRGKESG